MWGPERTLNETGLRATAHTTHFLFLHKPVFGREPILPRANFRNFMEKLKHRKRFGLKFDLEK